MVKWKRIIKKTIAVVSAVAMLAAMTDWSKVAAAAQEEEFRITENVTLSEEGAEADNDELFAGYVQKAFLGDSGISLFSTENHTRNLNADEKSIYAAIKSAVTEIAAGTRASTQITLNDWEKTFTYTELGLGASANSASVQTAVKTAFTNNISISKILCCLMADCPYELYWYDKTAGTSYSYGISANGSQCTLSSLCFEMTVASAYASGTYTANTTKTGATSTAVANAMAIVTENAGKSDYEKLVAYRDKICELVSYNTAAAGTGSTQYGDPWQLIYVFDNDSNTNVVCEGYSKAYQYLCELSDFDGDVICYTVSGYIPGGHMWNHVTIGGKNYLVDVTNCDEGAIGAPDKLFLKGMTGDISSGYRKTISSQTITYTFKDETKEMFGTGEDSILNLSADDYVESVDAVQSVSVTPSASSLTWHYKNQGATLTATPTLATGVTATPMYQWYKVSDDMETAINGATNATYTMETGLSAGTYAYRVYASIGDCKKSADVSVTVEPLVLTKDQLEFAPGTITKKYDGTTSSTATVQIKAEVVADEAVRIEGIAEYNSPNVSEADTVTFTPTAITNGNYSLAATETISRAAKIEKNSSYSVEAVNKKYLYSRDNADTIDLSSYLPENCGKVTYGTPQVNGALYTEDGAPAISNDMLSYEVKEGTIGTTGTISVKVTTDNYEDFTITVNVELVEKFPVNIKAGSSVSLENSLLTYGEALSTLTFNSAVFESAGKEVVGTLAWETPTVKPDVATTKAEWVFTPSSAEYASLEGEIAITVKKATPKVDKDPTVTARTYHPTVVLKDSDLTEGMVLNVNGTELKGTWSWEKAEVIPTVGNSGYTAVFTPNETDKANYDTVTRTITVTVNKASSAPNKPDNTMEADYAKEKVSDITTLPTGWVWQDADKDKSLTVGTPEIATAVYTGADKGNYEVESVEISITRLACTHAPKKTATTPRSLKRGAVVKDDKGVAKYKILGTASKEVAYNKTVNKKAKTVTIPTTVKINGVTYKVTQIADNAFANNKKITKVTIGSKVTTIGKKAFYGCKKLKIITIKTTKLTGKNVGSKVFKGIYSKATIKVPKSKLKSYKKLLKARGVGKKAKIKK